MNPRSLRLNGLILSVASLIVVGFAPAALAEGPAATRPTTRPTGGVWDPKLLAYAPAPLVVEEQTPTAEQVQWRGRPKQLPVKPAAPVATEVPAKPRRVEGIDVVRLTFNDAQGDLVPALLAKPAGVTKPLPVVVAIHGLGSNKAQVTAQLAPALIRRGFAVLAPDLPFHGERPGEPRTFVKRTDPLGQFNAFRQASIDVRQCIDLVRQRPDLDADRVFLAGYSLGSFVSSITGPLDPRVEAMVLFVGGALDVPSTMLQIPMIGTICPQTALPHFAGRPVFLANGKDDRVITPTMAERLFDSAADPKQQRWYDGGHMLPTQAFEDAADWLADLISSPSRSQPSGGN
jgi:fermentation-respiration switch protein FrsA (DUF1100 family)